METMEYIIKTIETLVNIPSPSGFTKEAIEFVKKEAETFGYNCELSRKGGLIITVDGKQDETIGLSAHVDTLGAMVRSINSDGTLQFTLVGGFTLHSVEGSYCKIHTRDGRTYTGTILIRSFSVHSFDDARSIERTDRNMLVRLDEMVNSRDDVLALGINSGDYISFDAKFEYTEKGFIKSVFWLFVITMIVPYQTGMVIIYNLGVKLRLINTVPFLILVYLGGNVSYSSLIYYAFTKSIPKEMEESAIIDGCGRFKTFFKIISQKIKKR